MQLKNIELPFSQEWYDETIGALSPMDIQTALSRVALLPEPQRGDLLITLALGMYLGQGMPNGGKAHLSQIKAGVRKGQWRFKLIGKNGEPVEPTNERYLNRKDALKTFNRYYAGFELVEEK